MLNVFREDLKDLKPYQIPRETYPVKLDANESPFDFPEELKRKVLDLLRKVNFNLYPGRSSEEIKFILSKFLGVQEDMIVLGNGLDDVIHIVLLAFGRGRKVIIPVPTFSMYRTAAVIAGTRPVEVPLTSCFDLDKERILKEAQGSPGIIFICNPNNPTGNTFPVETVEEIIASTQSLVAVDQAYIDFAQDSCLNLMEKLGKYERLILMRTFSKAFGLAGIRMGYVIASEEICRELNKVKQPFNMNCLSLAVAKIALENPSYKETLVQYIVNERTRVYQELHKIDGVRPLPSQTNFILFRTKKPAFQVQDELKAAGISIRNFSDEPLLENCLRVTIGRRSQNDIFLKELKKIMTLC